MLVLTRRLGQQILMGNGSIQVKILRVDRGTVSIGLTAPKSLDIEREEIFFKKQAQLQAESCAVGAIL